MVGRQTLHTDQGRTHGVCAAYLRGLLRAGKYSVLQPSPPGQRPPAGDRFGVAGEDHCSWRRVPLGGERERDRGEGWRLLWRPAGGWGVSLCSRCPWCLRTQCPGSDQTDDGGGAASQVEGVPDRDADRTPSALYQPDAVRRGEVLSRPRCGGVQSGAFPAER